MLSLSATFVYGARQLRSSTINVNSDVVYSEIVSSYRIIKKILCLDSITPWARTDIPSRFSIPLQLSLAREASSMFNDLQVSR